MKTLRIDTDMWRQRFRDPAWQSIGVLVTLIALLISIVVAYDVFQKSQLKPGLTVVLTRKYPIVVWSRDFDQEVEVYFRGDKAQNVSSFFFTLENTGGSSIRPDDYIKPIQLSIGEPGQIAKIAIASKQPGSIDLDATQVSTRTFELSKSLLNPGDRVEFQLILVDEDDPWSNVELYQSSGRVVGVSDIAILDGNESNALSFVTRGYFTFTVMKVLIQAIIAALLFGGTLVILRRVNPAYWSSKLIEWRIMAIAFMSAFTVGYLYSLVSFLSIRPSADQLKFWIPAVAGFGLLVGLYWISIFARILRNRR